MCKGRLDRLCFVSSLCVKPKRLRFHYWDVLRPQTATKRLGREDGTHATGRKGFLEEDQDAQDAQDPPLRSQVKGSHAVLVEVAVLLDSCTNLGCVS